MSEAPPDELDDAGSDAVLLALGSHTREREAALLDARAPEWEAVVNETLSVEDAVARRREAGDDDDQADRAAAYFRPFDADESASLLDGLLAVADAEPEPAQPNNVVALGRPSGGREVTPTQDTAHVRGLWWLPGGLLAAAAAAILLWWVWPPNQDVRDIDGEDGNTLAQREPLPNYVLETDGGLTQLRGDTGGDTGGDSEDAQASHRYRRATPFEWVLRPQASVAGEVGVRGFVFVDGGSAGLPLSLGPLMQIAESGAIRITGTIGQLELEPGRYTIVLAVGRPDDLPARAADAVAPANSHDGSPTRWALQKIDIDIDQ